MCGALMRIFFGMRISYEKISVIGYVFVIIALFSSTSSFYFFYAMLAFGVLLLVWDCGTKLPWSFWGGYVYVGSVFFLFILSVYRVVCFSNMEDLKEFLKVLIFASLVFFGVRLRSRDLEFLFSIFVVFNFAVSLLQYLGVYGFGVRELTDFYNAKHHIDVSLSYSSPRALGVSAGPGQQSVIGLFFFSYFVVHYFFGGGGYKRLFLCVLALFTVVLSQSKTALIALLFGSLVVMLLFVVHASYKGKLVMMLFLVAVLGGVVLLKDQILFLFPEYVRLSEQGGEISSLHSRFENWYQMLDVFFVEDSFVFYLFGVGRSGLEYYGVNDLPYDSDYIYILLNYGLVGLVLFLGVLGGVLVRGVLYFSDESLYGKFLVVVLVYALISATALNFFFEPRVLVLFAIFVSKYLVTPKVGST